MDDARDGQRRVDTNHARYDEYYYEYWVPDQDINREVIERDICVYLGDDATVQPYRDQYVR
jgi:hypothetical protein